MTQVNNGMGSKAFDCLIIDDDAGFASMLARLVRAEGGDCVMAEDLQSATQILAGRCFDLVLLDNYLPDGTGYEFHARLAQRCPHSVVVMITGAPQLTEAVALTRNGLFDYLTKPVGMEQFTALLRRAKQRIQTPETGLEGSVFVGNSLAMRSAVYQLDQAGRHAGAPVLLLGETGTGKDLAARYLHRMSVGKTQPEPGYVALNCPAVPSDMFEAELFGSEKGAYTGADRRRTGLVEAAEGGTLFLDEVAEIPLPLQAKLLRFLESREYRSLGSTLMRRFNGRVVAATNRDLRFEVAQGRFRADLLFRLDVFSVRLPPLRERPEDIQALAESLLTALSEKYGRSRPNLRAADLSALLGYSFPGNVRELRNLIERSLLRLAPSEHWLPLDLSWLQSATPMGNFNNSGPYSSPVTSPVATAPMEIPGSKSGFGMPGAIVVPPGLTPIEEQEYQLIARALEDSDGSIRKAASKVGLSHQTLLRRLQRWPELRRAIEVAASV